MQIVDPQEAPDADVLADVYHKNNARGGVTPNRARDLIRNNPSILGAMMVKQGMADALICGTHGQYEKDLVDLTEIVGREDGVSDVSALSLVVVPNGSYFICDTHVSPDPTAEEIAGMVRLAAEEVKRFGIEPKVALLSHSNFGTRDTPSAIKMREAVALLHASDPDLEVEGEMHADAAVNESVRAPQFAAERQRQPAGGAIAGCREHRLQPVENRR